MSVSKTAEEPILPKGWVKSFSKTHSRDYWFNTKDGTRSWTPPQSEEGEPPQKRRATAEEKESTSTTSSLASSSISVPKVAVIVPFRDLHEAQKRQEHLDRFVPEMSSFLAATGSPFQIYIIEQSNDNRKFNRGKLLNIGFELAKADGCQVFVFHDVDLLPSPDLAVWYTELPVLQPVHIAHVWNRYTDNAKYFGGIVAFSKEMFTRINGFPNNFWGWGGEDDEMYKRTIEVSPRVHVDFTK